MSALKSLTSLSCDYRFTSVPILAIGGLLVTPAVAYEIDFSLFTFLSAFSTLG
jgi:hypothetical protein